MKSWLRRLRGTVGMGLTWGGLGFLSGGVIELIHNIWPNPLGGMVDIWPAVLAFPGFVGGVVFSTVLGIAARRYRFDELSHPRVAAWGALGGVIVSLVPAAMVLLGLATANIPLWQITATLAIPFTLGSAVAASATLALARMSEDRELLDEAEDISEVGLTAEESRVLLGGGER